MSYRHLLLLLLGRESSAVFTGYEQEVESLREWEECWVVTKVLKNEFEFCDIIIAYLSPLFFC